MKALLLAAGLGTRLRPLTYETPKCLVPIKGKPLLGIWLERLTSAGIGPFLINTHYLSEKVEKYIKNSIYEENVKIVLEPELLGTAGTLIENLEFFNNNDGMLIHADNYCLTDLLEFIEAHKNRPNECLMTMMTFRTNQPTNCGIVELNSKNIVIGFHEKIKDPPSNLANGAVYILSKEIIKIIGRDFKYSKDFSTEIIKNFLGKIYNYETKEILIDIGTIENYNEVK